MSNMIYVAGVATVAAIVSAIYYQKKKREIIPWTWEEVGVLKKVDIYPLKSGGRVELTRAECTPLGLKQTVEDEQVFQLRDRCLVVYGDSDNRFRTARTYPKMMLVEVSVHDGKHLAIDAPAMRTLYVAVPSADDTNQTKVNLHGCEVALTIDCGDEAAQWFSRYLLEKDTGLRLGFHGDNTRRDVKRTGIDLNFYKNLKNDSLGIYSDLTSVLLVNQASVDDLNRKMESNEISTNNFRPNFVVEGLYLQPYDEDHWEWVKVGDVVMRNVKDCTRCMMTTINPKNAVRNSAMEPLTTLKTYRMSNGPEKLPVMGIHYDVRRTGIVSVGDKVYVSRSHK